MSLAFSRTGFILPLPWRDWTLDCSGLSGVGSTAKAPTKGTTMNRVTRRKFIQVASAAAAGSMVCCTRGRSPWRFFTLEEGQTADAICERLIPADQDPGASQVGVVNFLDIQLMGPVQAFSLELSPRPERRRPDEPADVWTTLHRVECGKAGRSTEGTGTRRGDGRSLEGNLLQRLLYAHPRPHDARLLRRPPARGKPRASELENGRLALPAHSRAVALRLDEWQMGRSADRQMGRL